MTRLPRLIDKDLAHSGARIELQHPRSEQTFHIPPTISIRGLIQFIMSGTGFSFGAKKIGKGAKPAPPQRKPNAFGADSDNEDDDAPKEQNFGSFGGIKMGASKPTTKILLSKPGSKPLASRGAPPKRKPNLFAGEDEKEDGDAKGYGAQEVEIEEFGGIEIPPPKDKNTTHKKKESASKGPPSKPPIAPPKARAAQVNVYGDLSANFTSKKYGETAEELDPSIYDYDAVYDSMNTQKHEFGKDPEKKKDYMKALRDAAALRKRDQVIAEERKLAKEREAEGDEFKDKEKFVTGAYKRQQEEARRLEKEEKEREEKEKEENRKTGFTGFYKQMLERKENEHQELVNAAERAAKEGPNVVEDKDEDKEVDEVEKARRINEALGDEKIAINDDGQLVDKRQLLKGGLNVTAAPKKASAPAAAKPAPVHRPAGHDFVGPGGGKQAMRERQTRMMEAQLEQATKRAREEEDEEAKKIERESKSRKTKDEIMGAKERYLQRKREAEEAKKKAAEGA